MTRSQGKISKQLVTTWVTVPPCFPAGLMDPSPLVGSSRGGGGGTGTGEGLGVGVLSWLRYRGCWGVCEAPWKG